MDLFFLGLLYCALKCLDTILELVHLSHDKNMGEIRTVKWQSEFQKSHVNSKTYILTALLDVAFLFEHDRGLKLGILDHGPVDIRVAGK